MNPSRHLRWLVIGYGNGLREDDGAGPAAAAAVEALRLPGVGVTVCHQLTPELSESLATVDCAVFLDAAAAGTREVGVRVSEIGAGGASRWTGHLASPESLLALTELLHARRPRAWCVAIPGERFGWGSGFSETTRRGVDAAVNHVLALHAASIVWPMDGAIHEVGLEGGDPCTRPA
jgi:hydrogenase maturation protease